MEFAHTQLHSACVCAITDRVNGEGLGSEAINHMEVVTFLLHQELSIDQDHACWGSSQVCEN